MLTRFAFHPALRMQWSLSRIPALAFALLALSSLLPSPVQAEDPTIVDFPVLLVSTGSNGVKLGQLQELSLELTRLKKEGPLQVAIVEETPSGAGDQLRASLWLAASTVALEVGKPLTGYRVQVTTRGRIDGPSAGAMMTLALLSALQERSLPQDFAFTGTILPNGSVGKVGGVIQKVEAAAKAGKKRVLLPASIRLELDANENVLIDIKDLCKSLNLEYVPVSSLREAMDAIYREPAKTVAKTLPPVPSELDDALVVSINRIIKEGNEVLTGLDEQARRVVKAKKMEALLEPERRSILQAYTQGSIAQAYRAAWEWRIGLEYINLLTSADALSYQQQLEAIEEAQKYLVENDTDDAEGLVGKLLNLDAEKRNPILAELDSSPHDRFHSEIVKQNAQSLLSQDDTSGDTRPTRTELMAAVVRLATISHFEPLLNSAQAEVLELEPLYPSKKDQITPRHRAVESLIYTSFLSVDDTFTTNIIRPIADAKKLSIEAAADSFADENPSYSSYRSERHLADLLHSDLENRTSLYELSLMAHSHAEAMARSSGQLLRYELEPDTMKDKDGTEHTIYRNAYLLRALLDSAREEALVAIGRCQEQKLGCWASVILVHAADAERDHFEADKLEVFVQYLTAALKAKLTRLMFGEE